MVRIETYNECHLAQLQSLMNSHLDVLVPGWALPLEYISSRLERNPAEYVTDPWVVERSTIMGLVKDRVCATAHVLRSVDEQGKGSAEICWFLAWPEKKEAGSEVLAAAGELLRSWGFDEQRFGLSLPIPVCVGVPDVWPHIAELLQASGYFPQEGSKEAVYGGGLVDTAPVGDPPIDGLEIRRSMGRFGTQFSAVLDGQVISNCACIADLTQGGRLPAFSGWAELSEIETEGEWRNKGIGSWVLRHAINWLRLAGCDRCVFAVSPDDEEAGAGRFYRRMGWEPLIREQKEWIRTE